MWKSCPRSPGWTSGLLIVAASLLTTSFALADEPIAWVDSTRDLYIDGGLDREAQLLLSEGSNQAAVVSAALPEILVYDRDSLALGTLDRQELVIAADRSEAASPRPATLDLPGQALRVDDRSLLIRAFGRTVLVAPHQGQAGEITRDELWRTAPVWKARFASHLPAPESVAALAAEERDVELTVVFGTWCGDSKRHVPELLKAVDLAANDRIRTKLISIGRGFEEPLDFVRDRRIINVPTVIATVEGEEIGRIIETPALESFAADLAAILAGRPPVHQGRWKRERRLARGTYQYIVDGSPRATEEWEMFTGPDGSTLVHGRLTEGARITETWHRRDAEDVTDFLEITRRDGTALSRSRFWIEDGRAQSVTRGDATGIVDQTIELPEGSIVLMPLAVDAVVPTNGLPSRAFRFGAAGAPTSGRLYPLELEPGANEQVSTPAGRFDAARIVRRVAGVETIWWLHPDLGVPVQGRLEDGVQVVLVELELFTDETVIDTDRHTAADG